MEIICQKSTALDSYLLEQLKNAKKLGISDILVPAGGTPKSFYKAFVNDNSPELEGLKLWQIDEIVNGPMKGHFYKFFQDHLGSKINQVIKVESVSGPPERPFYSFLGLGVNGHVAFHEPHIPTNFLFGSVELGQETLDYLELKERTWGTTFGLETFLASDKIFLMVKGEHKRKILQRFIDDDPNVPAVQLKKHPGLVLLLDDEVSVELYHSNGNRESA